MMPSAVSTVKSDRTRGVCLQIPKRCLQLFMGLIVYRYAHCLLLLMSELQKEQHALDWTVLCLQDGFGAHQILRYIKSLSLLTCKRLHTDDTSILPTVSIYHWGTFLPICMQNIVERIAVLVVDSGCGPRGGCQFTL